MQHACPSFPSCIAHLSVPTALKAVASVVSSHTTKPSPLAQMGKALLEVLRVELPASEARKDVELVLQQIFAPGCRPLKRCRLDQVRSFQEGSLSSISSAAVGAATPDCLDEPALDSGYRSGGSTASQPLDPAVATVSASAASMPPRPLLRPRQQGGGQDSVAAVVAAGVDVAPPAPVPAGVLQGSAPRAATANIVCTLAAPPVKVVVLKPYQPAPAPQLRPLQPQAAVLLQADGCSGKQQAASLSSAQAADYFVPRQFFGGTC